MKRSSTGYSSCIVTLLWATGSFGGEARSPADDITAVSVQSTLGEIEEVLRGLADNLEQQEAAWPNRKRDQANEVEPPFRVQKLQAAHRDLRRRKERLIQRLEAEARGNVDALLRALVTTDSPSVVDAVTPVAVRLGGKKARLLGALRALARRHVPCPSSVIDGLAALRDREAAIFLVELGIEERNLTMLRAAGNAGEPAAIQRIIETAQSPDDGMRELGRRAIARLTPPRSVNVELQRLITLQVELTHSSDLKAALIGYLGNCRDEYTQDYLERIYARHRHDERVCLAVLGAMGNLGREAGQFLLSELRRPENELGVRRACVRSLGTSRYKAASSSLIELLGDKHLKRDAARALERISGQRLGAERAAWLRWWSAQPEADAAE